MRYHHGRKRNKEERAQTGFEKPIWNVDWDGASMAE